MNIGINLRGCPAREKGFTLIELMIVVAVLAVLSAIALPLYRGYIETSREGTLINNINTIEVFEEDFNLRNGAYSAGVYNGGPDADLVALGWEPQADDGTVYTIVLGGGGYQVTAAHPDGTTVCRQMPQKTAITPCP